MAIRAKCPNPACGKEYKLRDELAGKTVRCDACRLPFQVPMPVDAEHFEGGVRSTSSKIADPLIGQKLGHYKVLERIGAGAMATVYKGHDLRLDKIVALKVMSPALMAQGREFVERFVQEARTAAKIEHPTVLPVYFIGVEGNHIFIAMQYVDGGTLDDRLKREGKLPVPEAVRIIGSVALALWAAHAQNIVHRDIKPSNIMLMRDGRVLVSDFGIAKVGEGPGDLTSAGMVLGTPAYMAPEHCLGQEVDGRADLYSTGVMFYRMVTGQPPYMGATPRDTIQMHLHAPVPDPRALVPDLDERVAAIIMRLMAKRPEDRFQTAAELVQALNEVVATPANIQESIEKQTSTQKSKALIFIASVIVLLVLGGLAAIGYFFVAQRQYEQEMPPHPIAAPHTVVRTPTPVMPQNPLPSPSPQPQSPATTTTTGPPPISTPVEGEGTKAPQSESEKKTEPKGLELPSSLALVGSEKPSDSPPKPSGVQPSGNIFDPAAYLEDVKPVNERISAGDFAAARARATLLKEKYPELMAMKLANIERIMELRKRCIERVNSGAAVVSMADLSKRFAFAGQIKKADDSGLTAAIKKTWDGLTKEEQANFYRKASETNNTQDLIAIAAFLVEGVATEKEYEQAIDLLGEAARLGADVSAHLKYVETLKKVLAEIGNKARETVGTEYIQRPTEQKMETGKSVQKPDTSDKSDKSFDDVYVATAATGEKIPHPLSRKVQKITYQGKRIEIPEGMVYVPAGSFIMGDDERQLSSPAHRVELDAFFIDKYEVTNAQYMEFVKATGHVMPEHIKNNGGEIPKGRENHPVTNVSWEDAKAYCEWCGKRLPTEAEWEKAASWDPRLKRKLQYPWGNEEDDDPRRPLANWAIRWGWTPGTLRHKWLEMFEDSEKGKELIAMGGATMPVGSFRKNISPYGCYDMIGNVAEWVEDWLEKYPGNTKISPQHEFKFGRRLKVARGGDWNDVRPDCTQRTGLPAKMRNYLTGFRCAKTP